MRRKHLLTAALVAAMSLSVVGCSSSSNVPETKASTESDSNETSTSDKTIGEDSVGATEDVTTVEDTEENTSVEDETSETSTITDETTEAAKPEKYEYSFEKVEGVSDKVADFENLSFSVNGKVYTFGKSTLNDMIKDGIITAEDIDKNVESLKPEQYTMSNVVMLHLSDASICQYLSIRVGNFTDKDLDVKDCVLQGIALDTRKYDGTVDMNKYEVNIGVSFDSTRAEIEAANAEGEYNEILNETEYTRKSDKYLGGSYIHYIYNNDGVLKKYEVNWLP